MRRRGGEPSRIEGAVPSGAHHDAAVEAAGAEEGGVEHVGAVGGGDDDDAGVALRGWGGGGAVRPVPSRFGLSGDDGGSRNLSILNDDDAGVAPRQKRWGGRGWGHGGLGLPCYFRLVKL